MHVHSYPVSMTSAAVIHSSVLESQNELSYAQFMVSDVRDLQAPKLQPLSGVGEVTVADWQTAVAVDLGSWPAAGAASARASSRRSIVGRRRVGQRVCSVFPSISSAVSVFACSVCGTLAHARI